MKPPLFAESQRNEVYLVSASLRSPFSRCGERLPACTQIRLHSHHASPFAPCLSIRTIPLPLRKALKQAFYFRPRSVSIQQANAAPPPPPLALGELPPFSPPPPTATPPPSSPHLPILNFATLLSLSLSLSLSGARYRERRSMFSPFQKEIFKGGGGGNDGGGRKRGQKKFLWEREGCEETQNSPTTERRRRRRKGGWVRERARY